MDYKTSEVLEFIEENDIKFIRLAFCDIFGNQKNITIMPSELKRAFEEGVSFDASAVTGFMKVEESDLLLFPEASTMYLLPWRPQHGRVVRFFCNIKHPDGRYFEGDCRNILKQVIKESREKGFICKIGCESEFYLFEQDEFGNPTMIPYDKGSYCDIYPNDRCENIRRDICLSLEEMGIKPTSSHHEQGPGQNEIDYEYSDALTAADNLISFRSLVKTKACENGLFASFMPRPLSTECGNGLHINISIYKNGKNLFSDKNSTDYEYAKKFLAGILNRIEEITLFLNSSTNSYARLGKDKAPKYITWSKENRSQLIRIPASNGDRCRMELRSPDSSCNPYIAFALLIKSGIEGIEKNLDLCDAYNTNLFDIDENEVKDLKKLPYNLNKAIELAKNSEFINTVLPQKTIDNYINDKVEDWNIYSSITDKFKAEKELYFEKL
ncbi:glutamine synthetase family protein [Intestinibacter bartlettii]|uniref:Glutamine synthetase family protein n=1 Tax=Intestinibacter bartlettii TaxID=261299 RepID=A0ABS6DSQ3_9FIRM|nr:glutamine synthetase family protein [Intestinibacter bartlettii]MBU5334856.1 glutamine synthetase family protein [Intestinibacter bartlettii]